MEYKLGYYVKLYDYLGNFITETISSFRYKFSEDEDDVCEIEFESGDPFIADYKQYKEGRSFVCQWGWFDGTESNRRKVYCFDRETHYKENGTVQLKLMCHEKFVIAKMDAASNKNLSQLKDNAPIIFSTKVITNINIAVEKGNTELQTLLVKNNINLKGLKSTKQYNKNEVIVSNYNGNMSTYYTLRKFLDTLPGGPYIMDSRDDYLLIRTRNFGTPSKKTFTWKGGTGELKSFKPVTKNRSSKASSQKITVSSYDPGSKTATNASSNSGDSNKVKLGEVNSLDINLNIPLQIDDGRGLIANPKLKDTIYVGGQKTTIGDELRKQRAQSDAQSTFSGPSTDNKPISVHAILQVDKDKAETLRLEKTKKLIKDYKDYKNNPVDVGFVVERVDDANGNSTLRKVYSVQKNGKTNFLAGSGITNRDNTAYAQNHLAFEESQVTVRTGLLTNDSAAKAAALADNKRQDQELETNPGSADLIGQPEIECGQIITILGVASEHAGNYYIQECEHILNESIYDLNIGKLVRDGVNRSSAHSGKKSTKVNLATLIPNNPNLKHNQTIILNTSKGPEASNLQKIKTLHSQKPDKS